MTKENVRKVILAILFVLILVVIALFIGRFTYSYLGPAPTDELTGTGEVTPSGDTIIFSKGNDLSLSASTDNFHTGSGNLTDTTNPQVRLIASSDTNDASTTYYAGIRIYENTYAYSSGTTAELILSVYDENGTLLEASSDTLSFVEVGGVKGFDITGLTGAYNIAIDHPISTTSSTNGTTHTWTFTLTFVNLDTDQSINETANLEMEVVLQKDRIEMPTIEEICSDDSNASLLACHVLSQYTGTDGENGLYYHDADLENGAGDNSYRYAGANPNNYVCFGSDAATCPSDNLYRIIGVFDNQVKLIKSTINGGIFVGIRWDKENDNTWDETIKPDIYDILNTTYWNTLEENWQGLIDQDHKWEVGGMAYSQTDTAKQYYDNEVGTNQIGYEETMAIGLMYVSDYGFSAEPSKWTIAIGSFSSNYGIDNWLNFRYLSIYEWTISRVMNLTDAARAFAPYYEYNGFMAYNGVTSSGYVRPSFYLEPSVELVSGIGTSTDPFRLNVI